MEGGTEPSDSKILGNYFPRMNLGLPIPASTQESEDMTSCIGVTLDKLHRSDTTVVLDLLAANGTDVREHHRKLWAF